MFLFNLIYNKVNLNIKVVYFINKKISYKKKQ